MALVRPILLLSHFRGLTTQRKSIAPHDRIIKNITKYHSEDNPDNDRVPQLQMAASFCKV